MHARIRDLFCFSIVDSATLHLLPVDEIEGVFGSYLTDILIGFSKLDVGYRICFINKFCVVKTLNINYSNIC